MTELMIRNGDYVPDGSGGFCRVEGAEALLQRVLWKLCILRGSFPFLPELGSRLSALTREKPGGRTALARQYVTEALADEEGLEVTGVALEEEGGQTRLSVFLRWNGDNMTLETTL